MARVETIVVGGGINAGSPFTLHSFLQVDNVDPPLASSGNLRQDTSVPPKVYVGEDSVFTGVTVLGGATSAATGQDAVVIGNGATNNATGVALGTNIILGNSAENGGGNGNVVIGHAASAKGSGLGSGCVVIGASAIIGNPAAASASILIGVQGSITLGSNQVVIGNGTTYNANNGGVLIGTGGQITGGATTGQCVAIGSSVIVSKTASVVVGPSCVATSQTNSVVIGNSAAGTLQDAVQFYDQSAGHGYRTLSIGNGDAVATPIASLLIRMTNGSGANVAAGSLTIQAGLSTGNAASAAVNLAVGVPGAAGAALQAALTGVACSHSVTAGDTLLMVYDVNGAALRRVSVGANDSGGVGFKLLRIPN